MRLSRNRSTRAMRLFRLRIDLAVVACPADGDASFHTVTVATAVNAEKPERRIERRAGVLDSGCATDVGLRNRSAPSLLDQRFGAPEGALFRALVDAGADPLVTYTADEQAESMVSESVAVQVQPILADIRHQFAERDRKLDALTEAGAEYGRKLDALTEAGTEYGRKLDALTEAGAEYGRKLDALAEAGAERDRKLDAIVAEIRGLKEVIAVRVDAQDREMRLIWGALGVLLTVLTVVFGFLFAG